MAHSNLAIEIEELSKTYDGQRYAVNGLQMQVKWGEIVGLIGPNGSGKSTTLNILTGLLKPTDGDVIIDDIDLLENPNEAKRLVSYIPDNTDLFPDLTAWEYAQLVAGLYDRTLSSITAYLISLFDFFGLTPYRHQLLGTYSHGMLKKAQLIAGLAHQPKILILDEPTSGLDTESQVIFKALLHQLQSHQVAVLLATHQMALAEELCDRICLLKDGQQIAWDETSTLMREHDAKTLEEVFIKLAVDKDSLEKSINEITKHL